MRAQRRLRGVRPLELKQRFVPRYGIALDGAFGKPPELRISAREFGQRLVARELVALDRPLG